MIELKESLIMSLPQGTWLAGGSEIAYPQLKPETAKVFLAEDSEGKREAVVASLTEFGLAEHLTVATTYGEAEEFMRAQEPGQLAADVFLLDGQLDESRPGGQRQGDILLQLLFKKYTDPIMTQLLKAGQALKSEGLVRRQIDEIIHQSEVREVAGQIVRKEAMFVGISRTDKGELSTPAQVPHAPYEQAGAVVFELAVPKATRNKIAKQQRREADRARLTGGQ
jgi:hypothetical protein